ncbi:hypothetical protein EVAR_39120_1 [Eumeta japonica]|uniref:Uncharacterized protein n=1 Tax=Eumeta variegata TaxID=151549 RepID=A0A4C1X5J5_EUMVA|nr:hypothetical protein EVAR_39120_1 [Eumeta japonica]
MIFIWLRGGRRQRRTRHSPRGTGGGSRAAHFMDAPGPIEREDAAAGEDTASGRRRMTISYSFETLRISSYRLSSNTRNCYRVMSKPKLRACDVKQTVSSFTNSRKFREAGAGGAPAASVVVEEPATLAPTATSHVRSKRHLDASSRTMRRFRPLAAHAPLAATNFGSAIELYSFS